MEFDYDEAEKIFNYIKKWEKDFFELGILNIDSCKSIKWNKFRFCDGCKRINVSTKRANCGLCDANLCNKCFKKYDRKYGCITHSLTDNTVSLCKRCIKDNKNKYYRCSKCYYIMCYECLHDNIINYMCANHCSDCIEPCQECEWICGLCHKDHTCRVKSLTLQCIETVNDAILVDNLYTENDLNILNRDVKKFIRCCDLKKY